MSRFFQQLQHLPYRAYLSSLGGTQRIAEYFVSKIRKRRFRDADLFLRDELIKNIDLNSAYAGRRAFVMGTGPSLSLLDLSKLRNEVTFGVNSFYRHPQVGSWSPTFYCLNDPNWFIKNGVAGDANGQLSEISKVCCDSIFLVSLTDARESLNEGQLPRERTRLIGFAGFSPGDFTWKPRLDRSLPGAYNIIHSAALEAMAVGCNPIYLIGCDHDITNLTSFTWGHFHEETEEEKRASPFLARFTAQDFYNNTVGLTHAYEDLRRIGEKWGFQIYNATRGGKLEVFDRVDYDSLF